MALGLNDFGNQNIIAFDPMFEINKHRSYFGWPGIENGRHCHEIGNMADVIKEGETIQSMFLTQKNHLTIKR